MKEAAGRKAQLRQIRDHYVNQDADEDDPDRPRLNSSNLLIETCV